MQLKLGMNTGFAINRFPEPDDWMGVIVDELGLDTIQLTADILNPFLPESIVVREVERIRRLCETKKARIHSTFTSAFTRVNHLLHPDPAIQRVWVEWFKRLIKITADLGGEGAGSCFGIMSVRDNADPDTRKKRLARGIASWRELSHHAADMGLKYLMFEPMSIPRECAETIPATQELLAECVEGFAVPMRLCLDVDHGDLSSADPHDTDPHAWIRTFGRVAPCVHIKQSLKDKGGHYPFTSDYNRKGRIVPQEIIRTLKEAGVQECALFFEISHRERWPSEYSVIQDLKESVVYWEPVVAAANSVQ
jgi:sugar phosphate isomerase/epimerase